MVSVMKTGKILTVKNPVIDSDFPDPDIIRVGNTYYMASTTMYFMPGCVILRSYDLVKWEILSHAYKRLDIPKSEVAHIYDDDTVRQVLERMEYHRYSCIPMLNRQGKYVGSITEGDLLWWLKGNHNLNLKLAEMVSIQEVGRRLDYKPVRAEAKMEDLMEKAMEQNFVPVVDDQGNFSGIITRKDIIGYFYDKLVVSDKEK